jgi:myo-inositol 2-dehydrogenase/D-chiro-inositol 1-dehydrogenase
VIRSCSERLPYRHLRCRPTDCGQARAQFGGKADLYENDRDLLAHLDVDVVTIGAPDHWHAQMLIDACRAGNDVYCEKPLTLTVAEGQRIVEVVRETVRIVQVGTWQRSDSRFRLACELVRARASSCVPALSDTSSG